MRSTSKAATARRMAAKPVFPRPCDQLTLFDMAAILGTKGVESASGGPDCRGEIPSRRRGEHQASDYTIDAYRVPAGDSGMGRKILPFHALLLLGDRELLVQRIRIDNHINFWQTFFQFQIHYGVSLRRIRYKC